MGYVKVQPTPTQILGPWNKYSSAIHGQHYIAADHYGHEWSLFFPDQNEVFISANNCNRYFNGPILQTMTEFFNFVAQQTVVDKPFPYNLPQASGEQGEQDDGTTFADILGDWEDHWTSKKTSTPLHQL